MKFVLRIILFSAFACLLFLPLQAQTNLKDTARGENETSRTAASGFAEEEFRRGVQSYYRGQFNESILEFEKALSYLPGESLIIEWLGKAYYRAGIEGAALQQWNFAVNQGFGGILLQNKIEIVGDRRITDSGFNFTQQYSECGAYEPLYKGAMVFSQPFSSLPNDDGSIWVASYGSNELVHFDVNGVVIDRYRGPLNGFDRPTDLIRLKNGNLLLCESAGNRLSLLDKNGRFIKYIGETGVKEGCLVGPQYAAEDSLGNIYVTDFGNSRIVVFDSDGNGILSFGGKNGIFEGFKAPTGIAVVEDRVFAADLVRGGIYEFDRSGNYMGVLVNDGTFNRPESLKVWGGYIVVCDLNRIVSVDVSTGAVFENARAGNGKVLLTSAVPDANGNLIVTDVKSNEIYVMATMNDMMGGLFVQIEKVISDNFPEVILEVRVENRRRQQIVGLKAENFLVTEEKRPVADFNLTGSANYNDFADITILIDRSIYMADYEEQLNVAVREIIKSMNGKGNVTVISAGEYPVNEYSGPCSGLENFNCSVLKNKYSKIAAIDSAIRLSANDLINREKKRGIIFLTTGRTTQNAFTSYSLSDLAGYLNNNSISFSTIMLRNAAVDDEIDYLAKNTTGSSYYIYRQEGLESVIKDIVSLKSGLYQLKYTSSLRTEYGRKYLPVEVETYLLSRSGRDESGYFAPLE